MPPIHGEYTNTIKTKSIETKMYSVLIKTLNKRLYTLYYKELIIILHLELLPYDPQDFENDPHKSKKMSALLSHKFIIQIPKYKKL